MHICKLSKLQFQILNKENGFVPLFILSFSCYFQWIFTILIKEFIYAYNFNTGIHLRL